MPIAATEKPAQAPARPAAKIGSSDEIKCQKEITSIRRAYKEDIPKDFRQIDHTKIEQIAKSIAEFQSRLQTFIKSCDADKIGIDSYMMLARMRTALETRVRQLQKDGIKGPELVQRMLEYNEESIQLCQKTLDLIAKIKDEKARAKYADLRCETMDLQGDIQYKVGDFEAALDNYVTLLKECPSYSGFGTTVTGAARTYKALGRTKEGIPFIKKYIESHYGLSDLPFFYESLWNLLVTDGDIGGMVEWCKKVQETFPIRMMRDNSKRYEKDGFRRYLGFSGFRLGYALLARGDLSGAVEAFQKHVEDTDKLEGELHPNPLPKELEIYKTRSLDNLKILEEAIGDPPGMDIELEDFWATPRRVTLAESRGKAVAILFRGDNDRRSKHFLTALDKHLAERPEDKDFVILHYMKGTRDLPGQLDTLQGHVREMELVAAAVGMDPDADRKSLFRAFRATIGTATFMIFDRYGKLAWWQQDPRAMDANLAIAIWERLASE